MNYYSEIARVICLPYLSMIASCSKGNRVASAEHFNSTDVPYLELDAEQTFMEYSFVWEGSPAQSVES
jgi:hypothetical protein